MKPYGIPRTKDVEYPDVGDIQHYGFKSSVGKFPEKCGDYKPYTRNAANRQSTRRYWKRIERAVAHKNIQQELVVE